MNSDKKKRVCIFISEEVDKDFTKKSKDTGIRKSFIAEKLLLKWLSKPIQTI